METILPFSEIMIRYRKGRKLSQEEMGKLLGKSQVSISNYEKEVHYPSDAEEIKLIARIVGISVNELIDSIEYQRRGIIHQPEQVIIELDRLEHVNDLKRRFKFVYEGEEVTSEELDKMLHLLEFKRFIQKQGDE